MPFFKDLFKGLIDDDDEPEDKPDKGFLKRSAKPYYGTVRPDPDFSASRDAVALQKAIEAKGVDENIITEILARRTNAQRQEIKAAFQENTGKDLLKALDLVLKSQYQDVVLALLMTPAEYDAHELRKALKGFGTKEHVLNEILGTRSNQEINSLKTAFKNAYGEELEHDIDGDTRGHYQTTLLTLCKGNRNEDDDIDDGLAKSEAKSLFEAGEKKIGTVSSVFIHILTSRSEAQLRKIFKQYEKLSPKGFAEAVKDELSGDTEDCLMTLVKAAWNKPAYFAERMHLAMKVVKESNWTCLKILEDVSPLIRKASSVLSDWCVSLVAGCEWSLETTPSQAHGSTQESQFLRGADHNTLIRIIVSRSEVDLKKILHEYKRLYGIMLQQDILEETRGDYERILLLLCGD